MASLTREYIRDAVGQKARDAGHSNFTDEDIDEAGLRAYRALFPALWRVVEVAGLTPDTVKKRLTVSTQNATRVFAVLDNTTGLHIEPGWYSLDETRLINVKATETVDALSYEPYSYPPNDGSAVTFPDEWLHILFLGAEAELLEGGLLDKSNYRGYDPSDPSRVDTNELVAAANNAASKFFRLRDDMAKPIPTAGM